MTRVLWLIAALLLPGVALAQVPGGGSVAVTDLTTTVANAIKITVAGGTVTNLGGGNAEITISGGGIGCTPAGGNATTNLITYGAAGACAVDVLANVSSGALTLGASGTLGSLILGNATSGTINIHPVTGAITGTVLVPTGGGTLALAATTLAGYGITDGATNGANSNITSLTGLTTPLSVAQGGSGAATLTSAGIVLAHGTSAFTALAEVDGDCVVGAAGAWTAASCGGGGGSSWNLTDGTTSLTAVTALTVPGGTLKVGGTAGAATLTPIVTDTSHTTSATTANIGGQDDYNGSSITATLASLAAGQTLVVTDQNATALTLALGGQTVNGLPLATTLHTGGFYGFSFNTTTSQLSGFGFPGFGTITSGALMKFTDASGAATAGDLSGDCTTSGSLVVTCAKGSASTFGIVKVDGVTVTASGGVISAVGGAATTITPGTTTIAGATAPCTIRNTATTVMGCTAETGTGSVVLSASPALTGTPTAPTATVGTNTTQLATTAFVIANAGGGGGSSVAATPQGRLTLQTGAPVMTSDQTAKTTVFYDTYAGNLYPNWSGSAMANVTITSDEISMGLDAVTPHIASGSLYDVYGTAAAAICAGPAWSSTTARGTGAGTTELQLKSGVWTNKNSLTHCWGGASGTTDLGAISANQGTYLGTIYATANGQTGMAFFPAAASGGSNNILGLYNAYNRVPIASQEQDSTVSWSYTTATWRAANASNSNRVTVVDGLQQSSLSGVYQSNLVTVGGNLKTAVNLDSASATPGQINFFSPTGGGEITISFAYSFAPQLGLHFIQAMEEGDGSHANETAGAPFSFLELRLSM